MAPVAIATKKTDSGRRRAEEGHLQPKGEERTSLTALEKEVLAEEVRVWAGPLQGWGWSLCVCVGGRESGAQTRHPGGGDRQCRWRDAPQSTVGPRGRLARLGTGSHQILEGATRVGRAGS